MTFIQLIRRIDTFFKLATESEKVPEASKDVSTILKTLTELETFKARVDYAEKCLDHLSSGSSRVIYTMPGGKEVMKLAKNDRGVAQNLVESKVKSKYVNKTTKSDPDGVWKLSPFLEKVTEKEFEKMAKCSFEDFGEAVRYALKDISGSDVSKPKNYEDVSKLELFKEVVSVAKKHDLMAGDIARISSWGQVDGHPTLLDAGLTRKIYDEFYE